jgi:hypothetical protein
MHLFEKNWRKNGRKKTATLTYFCGYTFLGVKRKASEKSEAFSRIEN